MDLLPFAGLLLIMSAEKDERGGAQPQQRGGRFQGLVLLKLPGYGVTQRRVRCSFPSALLPHPCSARLLRGNVKGRALQARAEGPPQANCAHLTPGTGSPAANTALSARLRLPQPCCVCPAPLRRWHPPSVAVEVGHRAGPRSMRACRSGGSSEAVGMREEQQGAKALKQRGQAAIHVEAGAGDGRKG